MMYKPGKSPLGKLLRCREGGHRLGTQTRRKKLRRRRIQGRLENRFGNRPLSRHASGGSHTVLRRSARCSRRAGLEAHQGELPLHSGEDSRRQPGRDRRSRRGSRRRRRRAGPSTARHPDRQSEKWLNVRKHRMWQFGAKGRGHRRDWWWLGGGLRVPVDGETARVNATGRHAAGGNNGGGTWTRDTTRVSNSRCGGGQAGYKCTMHTDIIHARCTQRRAIISEDTIAVAKTSDS